jgi:hypothetical protein
VADPPCILVLLLVKVGANAKVLTHFMKGVMGSPLSESQLVRPELWLLKRRSELVGRWEMEWDVLRFMGCDTVWLSPRVLLPSDTRLWHVTFLGFNPICNASAQVV